MGSNNHVTKKELGGVQMRASEDLNHSSPGFSSFHCWSELRSSDHTDNPGQTCVLGGGGAWQESAEVKAFAPFFQFLEERLPVW